MGTPFSGIVPELLSVWQRVDISEPFYAQVAPQALRTILAAHFGGYDAVDAMGWVEWQSALQFLTEQHYGDAMRHAAAKEDAAAKKFT